MVLGLCHSKPRPSYKSPGARTTQRQDKGSGGTLKYPPICPCLQAETNGPTRVPQAMSAFVPPLKLAQCHLKQSNHISLPKERGLARVVKGVPPPCPPSPPPPHPTPASPHPRTPSAQPHPTPPQNTLEEKIVERAERKLFLDRFIIEQVLCDCYVIAM